MLNTYVLGLDFSATHLGLVVIESNTSKVIGWLYAGVTNKEAFVHSDVDYLKKVTTFPISMLQHSDKNITKLRRGIFLFECVEKYIKDNVLWLPSSCKCIAIERYVFASKSCAQFETAEALGMIKQFLDNNDIVIHIYFPNTIKLFATGKGNAKKKEMVLAAKEQWNEFDIMSLIKIGKEKGEEVYKGIGTDLVDAYFLAKKLLFDLKN